MIHVEYYREFVEIARLGSFSAAAEQLFISQSSLSKHIAALEKELGATLFQRSTRSVELSEFGAASLPYAQKLAEMDEHIRQLAGERFSWKGQGAGGEIRLMSVPVTAAYGISDLVGAYYKKRPEISISVTEREPGLIPELLEQRRADMAFVRTSGQLSQRFDSVEYCREEVVAVLPVTHPLASRDELLLSQLRGEKFLLISEQAHLHQICVDLCIQAGFTPQISFTSLRMENLVSLIAQGMGVSLFSQAFYECYRRPQVIGIRISPTAVTGLSLIRRKGIPLSRAASEFWDYMAARGVRKSRNRIER